MTAAEDCIGTMLDGDREPILVGDRWALIVATSERALHTGRRRYLVACLECRALVHESTTGPLSMFGSHECHRGKAP